MRQVGAHNLRSASPVAVASASPSALSPAQTTHVVTALDSPSSAIPGLDITASLAALMIALLLGVGLIVYRAGYRGERTR